MIRHGNRNVCFVRVLTLLCDRTRYFIIEHQSQLHSESHVRIQEGKFRPVIEIISTKVADFNGMKRSVRKSNEANNHFDFHREEIIISSMKRSYIVVIC